MYPSLSQRPVAVWFEAISATAAGVIRLRTADGEEYQWSKVTSTVGNLIIGKLYVDHAGIMHVRNMGTGLAARLKFKEQGLIMDRNPHQVPTPLLPHHALSGPLLDQRPASIYLH